MATVGLITQTGNKSTGKNAVIKWGDDIIACLTQIKLQGTGSEVSQACSSDGVGNATVHKEVGDSSWSPTTTIMVDKDDITLNNELMIGNEKALVCYPFGDEVGMTQYAWTVAKVLNHGIGSGPNAFGLLDIQFTPTGDPTITKVTA